MYSVKRAVVIGVMGPGDFASPKDEDTAYRLGRFIASQGWITLSGGRDCGVMAWVSRGARAASGLTVGILPGRDRTESMEEVVLPVMTDLGNARNNINVLSSDVVVALAFRIGAGTASEVALAIKAGKPVLLLTDNRACSDFFESLGGRLLIAEDFEQAALLLPGLVAEVMGDDESLPIRLG